MLWCLLDTCVTLSQLTSQFTPPHQVLVYMPLPCNLLLNPTILGISCVSMGRSLKVPIENM